MTATIHPAMRVTPRRRGPIGWPMWAHVALLALVLGVGLAVVGTRGLISADEGAALTQARLIEQGNWGSGYRAGLIDPEGRWFPIHLSDHSGGRWYPYVKLPAYPALVAVLLGAGGLGLVLVGQLLGTVAAAACAGLLARRLAGSRPRAPAIGVATVWAVGIGSPLMFDSYWVLAHSIAAAGATFAALGMVMVVDRRPVGLAAMASGLAVAVMFRTEGVLFGVALAAACGVAWLLTRRALPIAAAAVVAGVTALGYYGNAQLARMVMGGASAEPFVIRDRVGWLAGRWPGFVATFLTPQLRGTPWSGWLLVGGSLGLAVGIIGLRRRSLPDGLVRVVLVCSAAAVVLRCLMGPTFLPGILVTFPVGVAGMCLLRRRELHDVATAPILAMSGLFAAAIVATQYSAGGTGDWGGRYLHLVVPAVAAVSVVAVSDLIDATDRRTGRAVVATLVAMSLGLAVFGLRTAHYFHSYSDRLTTTVDEVARRTGSAAQTGGPVVLTDMESFGRFAWRSVLDGRYLRVTTSADLGPAAAALDRNQVPDLTVVTRSSSLGPVLDGLGAHYAAVPGSARVVGDWSVVVLRRR